MVYRAKNKKQSKNHHAFLFIILALIVCAVVIVALFLLKPLGGNKSANSDQGTNNTSSSTDQKTDQKPDSSEPKKEEEKPASNEPAPEAEKNNPQYEGNNPNSSDSLTGIINYIGIADGTLSVRVSVEQAVSGACVFTITTPTGKTINGSGELTLGPTSAFCSFSTPATESGRWQVSVTATSSDKHGTITGEANL